MKHVQIPYYGGNRETKVMLVWTCTKDRRQT